MIDTAPAVERRYHEMLMALPPERRLGMGASMHATARALARAAILAAQPDATALEVRQALFVRFYGRDFSAAERERILAWLARAPAVGEQRLAAVASRRPAGPAPLL